MINRGEGEGISTGWRVAAGLAASLGALTACAPGGEGPNPAANDDPAAEAQGFGEQAASPDVPDATGAASVNEGVLGIPGYRMGGTNANQVAAVVIGQVDSYLEGGSQTSLTGFNDSARADAQRLAESGVTGVAISPDAEYTWTLWPDQDDEGFVCLEAGHITMENEDGTTFDLGPDEGDLTHMRIVDASYNPEDAVGGLSGLATFCVTSAEVRPPAPDTTAGTTVPTTEATTTTTIQTPETAGQPLDTTGNPLPPLAPGVIHVDPNGFRYEGGQDGMPIPLGQEGGA